MSDGISKLKKVIEEQKIEIKSFNRPDRPPAVFMFQPTHFVTLTGDNVQIWEQLMKERVGISGGVNPHLPRQNPWAGGSGSFCGGNLDGGIEVDDCDE